MKRWTLTFFLTISLLLGHKSVQCQNKYYNPLTLEIGTLDSIFRKIFICADSSYSCLDHIAQKDATILGEFSEYNLEAIQEINLVTTFDKFKNFTFKLKRGKINVQIPHYNSSEDRTGAYEEDGYIVMLGAYCNLTISPKILRPVILDKKRFTIPKDTFFIKVNGLNMFLNKSYEVKELTTYLPYSGMTSHSALITKDSIIVRNIKTVIVSNQYRSSYNQDNNKKWTVLTINNAEILLPKSSKFMKTEYFTIDIDGNSDYKISK